MKNYLTIILAACLVCLAGCGSKASKQVEAEEGASVQVSPLSVQGTQLVNDKGEKVVLHGVSYGWHVWWPRPCAGQCIVGYFLWPVATFHPNYQPLPTPSCKARCGC